MRPVIMLPPKVIPSTNLNQNETKNDNFLEIKFLISQFF